LLCQLQIALVPKRIAHIMQIVKNALSITRPKMNGHTVHSNNSELVVGLPPLPERVLLLFKLY
jgi:hypothetical protein